MSAAVALARLAGGGVLVVAGSELFFEGILAAAARLGVNASAFQNDGSPSTHPRSE